jgi:hypothetical protein
LFASRGGDVSAGEKSGGAVKVVWLGGGYLVMLAMVAWTAVSIAQTTVAATHDAPPAPYAATVAASTANGKLAGRDMSVYVRLHEARDSILVIEFEPNVCMH